MAYIGVFLAFVYLYIALKVVIKSREAGDIVYVTPFGPVFMGTLFGTVVLLSTVGFFVLFGASWPTIPVMATVMAISIVVMVGYYWMPIVKLVDCFHGLKNKRYVSILFW